MGNKVSGHAAQAPVGDWQSPISSELIVSKTIKLSEPCFGPGGSVCWLEGRPEEGGRSVLVCRWVNVCHF